MFQRQVQPAGGACLVSAADFKAKLDDEIYRAKRHNVPLALVALKLAVTPHRIADLLSVMQQLRRLDFVAKFGLGGVLVCLPHTPLVQAEVVANRLAAALPEAAIRVLGFPESGRTLGELLRAAEILTQSAAVVPGEQID